MVCSVQMKFSIYFPCHPLLPHFSAWYFVTFAPGKKSHLPLLSQWPQRRQGGDLVPGFYRKVPPFSCNLEPLLKSPWKFTSGSFPPLYPAWEIKMHIFRGGSNQHLGRSEDGDWKLKAALCHISRRNLGYIIFPDGMGRELQAKLTYGGLSPEGADYQREKPFRQCLWSSPRIFWPVGTF